MAHCVMLVMIHRTYTESWLTQFECITEQTYRSQPIWREEDDFRCGRRAEQAGASMWEVQRKPHGCPEDTLIVPSV